MQCKHCGYVNEDNTRFCVMCGKALTPQEAPPPSQASYPPPTQPPVDASASPAHTQASYPPSTQPPVDASASPSHTQASYPPPQPPVDASASPFHTQVSYPPPPPPQQTGYVTPPSQSGYTQAPPTGTGYTPAQPVMGSVSVPQQPSGYPQVPQQPGSMPTYPPPQPYAMPPQQQAWAGGPQQPHPPKRKKKKGKIIGLSLLVVLILLVAGFLIYSLPLRPVVELDGTRQTIDGTIRNLSFSIKTNQLIRGVSYALDPTDPDDMDAYTQLEDLEGGLFKKTGDFPTLSLDKAINDSYKERGPWERTDHNAKIGNHVLYIRVKTLFGTSKPLPFNLHYASGISALPDRSKIKRISDETAEKTILTNEILVSLNYGSDRSVAEALAAETGGEIVGEIPSVFRYQFRYKNVDETDLEAILSTLLASPNVTSAQFNYIYDREETQFYPNDKMFDSWDVNSPDGNNWGLEVIRAPLVWQGIDRLTPISIGIADGGLEYDHEDLGVDRSNIYLFPTHTLETIDDLELYYAKSKKSEGSNYFGKKEHGTHVTGIMAEKGDNGIGAAGVNWNTVPHFFHYWHMGVNEDTGELDMWNVTTSFELEVTLTTLVEQGCRVINFSVGDCEPSQPGSKHEYIETQAYGDLCLRLEQLGYDFLVFKAAGNKAHDAYDYEMNRIMTGTDPARRHTVIVASIENTKIDYDDDVDPRIKYAYRLSDFSNYGSIVDVAAPGSDIFSTIPNQGYGSISGTSMASPMAAGVASLIYGAHPEYTASEVKAILIEETDTFTTDGENLIPVVNAALSSDYARTGDPPQVPPDQVIPDPKFTPYPGPPKPLGPGVVRLPGHTPFAPPENMGGFAGFVCDAETGNRLALFSVRFTDANGQVVNMDFSFPYPDIYDAKRLGEFYSLVITNGGESLISDLVIEALGYQSYEVPPFTVRDRSVVDLGTIALAPESEEIIRLPGHTPFTPEEGKGGFTGFVYDDATKRPIPNFSISFTYQGTLFDQFDYVFPPTIPDILAKLEGEYLFWAKTDSQDVVENVTISADGYETGIVGDIIVREGEVTDAGVIYLKRVSDTADPEPQPPEPQPVRPDPNDGVIRLPGHTPFTPEEGCGGFAGFVYDAVTKQPIPSFRFIDLTWLDGAPADFEDTYFNWPYDENMLAQIEGEFIYWVDTLGQDSGTMSPFTIAAEGYESAYIDSFVVVEGAVTDLGVIELQPLATAPPDSGVVESITLEWGASPEDLDLHLTAPFGGDGTSFHIFAFEGYRQWDYDIVSLALTQESSTGYGPEVIAIDALTPDIPFTVYVHDFTNTAKESDSRALADSGATVSIKFAGVQQPLVFNVPSQEGTLWKVCTIYGGKVTGVNEMSYEGRPLNIGADD
ncbi:MAG TPA: S8 family serine peptidase [Clostridiaceae bacterium]|nr:S8 family serine peptidase [Clostridiaceae bacterium]